MFHRGPAHRLEIREVFAAQAPALQHRIVIITQDRRMADLDELLDILIVGRSFELIRCGIVRKQIDVRPHARMELFHHAANRRQTGKVTRWRFIAQVISKNRRVMTHLADQFGHLFPS